MSSKRGFKASNINIPNSNSNFNPSVTKHKAIKEENATLIDELENLIRKVRNNKEENMEKDKDKKGKKVNNEDVDKKEILHEEACFRNRFSLYQSVNKNHLCYS